MALRMNISNTPIYNDLENKIVALDLRYGPTKSMIIKDVKLMGGLDTEPNYIPTALNWYEVYQSPNLTWYSGMNAYPTSNKLALVRCGGLITLCLPELFIFITTPGNPIHSATGVIPTRFLPGSLLSGTATSCTFPILTIDNNGSPVANNNGKAIVNINGSIYIYNDLAGTGFSNGSGFPSTYLSWLA
jgi:hypothetical protein